jgi:Glycosyl-4,4'-diaponeurosporenoate acyltransferase
MIPNLLWSLVGLVPVGYFCYTLMPPKLVYIFLGLSLSGYALPSSFYNNIQIKNLNFLKKTGVGIAQKFAQNGDIINRLIRNKFPGYKTLYNRKSIESQYKKTYFFEKFHFVMLLFFLFTTIFALVRSYYLWALIITITNIIYNIYPILLQHYTRLRIELLLRRKTE